MRGRNRAFRASVPPYQSQSTVIVDASGTIRCHAVRATLDALLAGR
jgi:hypothetical protein